MQPMRRPQSQPTTALPASRARVEPRFQSCDERFRRVGLAFHPRHTLPCFPHDRDAIDAEHGTRSVVKQLYKPWPEMALIAFLSGLAEIRGSAHGVGTALSFRRMRISRPLRAQRCTRLPTVAHVAHRSQDVRPPSGKEPRFVPRQSMRLEPVHGQCVNDQRANADSHALPH